MVPHVRALHALATFALFALLSAFAATSSASPFDNRREPDGERERQGKGQTIQLGPRPFFLVNDMEPGDLKNKLSNCANGEFRKSDFSIGHRGAALQFPEHTKESYEAAAIMGAGIVECDVTFTKDKELVCRHSQCDLHTTTNILDTLLAGKCRRPFTPAQFDAAGNLVKEATAQCCTSDLSVTEFKRLKGKMEAHNPVATSVKEYLGGTPRWRTELYAGPTSGTLLTHRESIQLFKKLGVKMIPDLKTPSVPMPYDSNGDGTGDYSQQDYAQQMIDEYKRENVKPDNVYPQSFDIRDIRYWMAKEPQFGKQAVYLIGGNTVAELPDASQLAGYKAEGINIIAPPMFALLTVDGKGNIAASEYARRAKAAGLDIITWTLERSGILAAQATDFYYQTVASAIRREGDVMTALHVLARDAGIKGIFSDWPATVTYYANCMDIK